jgi:hypothetical protein
MTGVFVLPTITIEQYSQFSPGTSTLNRAAQKPDFLKKENRCFWCKNPMVFGFSSTRNPNPSE